MQIVLNNPKSKYLEVISLENLDIVDETFKKFSSLKRPLKAKIFAINESISSQQLSEFKKNSKKIIFILCLYTPIIEK